MPLHLKPVEIFGEVEGVASALIVSCPVCPPVSLAVDRESPLIQFFRAGIKTPAFEDYIRELRASLEQRGVRTGAFSMYTPLPTMCLWTRGQRRRLLKRARGYEAVIVLGCDSATHSVRRALEGTPCRVMQAMRMTGLTNATVNFKFPMTLKLAERTQVNAGDEIGPSRQADRTNPPNDRERRPLL